MKISNETLTMLKWMSTVNGGIKIDAGNKLYTKSEAGSMCAVVKVKENFDSPFIASNLQKFLAIVSLYDNPEFEFGEEFVKISSSDGKNKTKFYQSNPALVNQSNKVPRKQTDIAISFHLKSEDLQRIFKAATVMNVSDIRLTAMNGLITMTILNKSIKTTDVFDIVVGECDENVNATFYYKKQNLKIITDYDYDVEVYPAGLTKFSATNLDPDKSIEEFDVYCVTTVEE